MAAPGATPARGGRKVQLSGGISPCQNAQCALANRYPSLGHSGVLGAAEDESGHPLLLSGKAAAGDLLCTGCIDLLKTNRFCKGCAGCNCVQGAGGDTDCLMHRQGDDQEPGSVAFTVARGNDSTSVCDNCTQAATAAKKLLRAKQRVHNSRWSLQEKAHRQRWGLRPAPALQIVRRPATRFGDHGVMFLTELHRQYRNFGSADWTHKFSSLSAAESRKIWEARMVTLATAEMIGDHLNFCRILFTDPRRRDETPVSRIKQIWSYMHRKITTGKLQQHTRKNGTIDWVSVTGGPAYG